MNPCPIELNPATIAAINSELQYQASLPDQGRPALGLHGVEGQLVTLAVYTRRAFEAWTDNATSEQALHGLRKVAAIAARALILYGAPQREGHEQPVSGF
jgi:hypothetical protein